MKWNTLSWVFFAGMLLLPSSVYATEVLDAYYDVNDDGNSAFSSYLGQTFTVENENSPSIAYIDVLLQDGACADGNKFYLGIRNTTGGTPITGTYQDVSLRWSEVDCSVLSGTSWVRFTATSSLPVTTGGVYAITLKASQDGVLARFDYTSPTYTGGSAWCGGASGASWTNCGGNYDMLFRVYVSESGGGGGSTNATTTYQYFDLGTSSPRFQDCVILSGTSSCMIIQQQGNIQFILLVILTILFYIVIAHLYYQIFPSKLKL